MRMRKRARRGGGDSHDMADEEVMVRQSSIAACVTCELCGRSLRDATTISECLHAFCRKCIVDAFKNTSNCPKCGIDLGCYPLEKLRPDRNLECIGSMISPSKRHKFEEFPVQPAVGNHSETKNLSLRTESNLLLHPKFRELQNERAGKTAAVEKIIPEGTALAPVPSSKTNSTEVQVEVVDETLTSHGLNHEFLVLDLAPVGTDTLARIRCRDYYVAPSLSAEAGALTVCQPPSVQNGISYDQTTPRQRKLTTVAPVQNQIMGTTDPAERQANSPFSGPPATTVLATSSPLVDLRSATRLDILLDMALDKSELEKGQVQLQALLEIVKGILEKSAQKSELMLRWMQYQALRRSMPPWRNKSNQRLKQSWRDWTSSW